jgi:hypothetical protein
MAKKIVRDVKRGASNPIKLDALPVKKNDSRKKNAVDLSHLENKSNIYLTNEVPSISDLKAKKPLYGEDVFYLQIDAERKFNIDKLGEIIRMAAAGILILFFINCINIFQRGVVLKDNVIALAFDGYENLLSAGENVGGMNLQGAQTNLDRAQQNFNNAIGDIYFLQSNSNNFFTTDKTVDSIKNLLEAASKISSAGDDFIMGFESLKRLPESFIEANRQIIASQSSGKKQGSSLTVQLKADLEFIQRASDKIISAVNNLDAVNEDILPSAFRGKFISVKEKVRKISEILAEARSQLPALLDLLGDRYPHRFLVLLQNDAEARPTGGFIGSVLIVDINDGYITKMEFHDVYDYDGQLNEPITPPPDIAKVSKNWRLRDSNYSPDFPTSAEKSAWFLQQEGGPGVDSVIAINQSLISDLFDLTGPIQIPGLTSPLNRRDYQFILSYIIESKLSGEQSPKTILGEFIPIFVNKLFTSNTLEKTIPRILTAVRDKQIMAYSNHPDLEKLFLDYGLGGATIKTAADEDYLNVINSSIGGNKSDIYITQSLKHNTLILNDGSIVDELSITRSHKWSNQNLQQLKEIIGGFGFSELPDYIIDILGRGKNMSFVKVYVPKNSELIGVSGIEKTQIETHYDPDTQKTFFMFQIDVAPSSDKTVTISYSLPYKLKFNPADSYRFFAQSQPAINKTRLEKNILIKPGLTTYKYYPSAGLTKNENGYLTFAGFLSGNLFMSALVGE